MNPDPLRPPETDAGHCRHLSFEDWINGYTHCDDCLALRRGPDERNRQRAGHLALAASLSLALLVIVTLAYLGGHRP
jgi:hypothetical protein